MDRRGEAISTGILRLPRFVEIDQEVARVVRRESAQVTPA
jgi:hypothetical protein